MMYLETANDGAEVPRSPMANFPLKTVIIGCGRIGALADDPSSATVMTHAHAIVSDSRFQLSGLIDPDSENLKLGAARWKCPGFETMDRFTSSGVQADVFIIASPDALHLQHIQEAIGLHPRALIVEKPVAKNLAQLRTWVSSTTPSLPILVNYSRRYMSIYQDFLSRLQQGEFGRFLHGSGSYSKGLLHSGSHLLNAILPILERDLQDVVHLGERTDFTADDPSVDSLMRFQDGSHFLLRSVDANLYEVFEIELFFERVRIRFDQLGQRVSYDSPKVLNASTGISYIYGESAELKRDDGRALQTLYSDLFETLNQRKSVICDLEDSIRTLSICEKLKKK
jgi:predicted dehydrogenase